MTKANGRARSTSGARTPASAKRQSGASSSTKENSFRARVRMYRQGLGDCFLIALPRQDGGTYYLLIDCGVILGTANAKAIMTEVVDDIVVTTGGHVDLLLATHEHWDHLSGFVQAAEAFKQLTVANVWLAWTEDPTDPLAQQLAGERDKLRAALQLSSLRLRLNGAVEMASEIDGFLQGFGAVKGLTSADALAAVRQMAPQPPRYCKPHDDPVELAEVGARLYVLGPPYDERRIKQAAPSERAPETYGLALDAFLAHVAPLLAGQDAALPFGTHYAIPMTEAQNLAFFKSFYWRQEDTWRRIDGSWLEDAADLALQLDTATNNTSLVTAIELADGDVLLFAADAQVGNWLSWQDLKWTVGERTVSGPDLLKRAIFYKVGHHGSHNATLKAKGVEMMDNLRIAMIPVNHEMALKKHWTRMPLHELVAALDERTHGAVVRADEPTPAGLSQRLTENKLYVEVEL